MATASISGRTCSSEDQQKAVARSDDSHTSTTFGNLPASKDDTLTRRIKRRMTDPNTLLQSEAYEFTSKSGVVDADTLAASWYLGSTTSEEACRILQNKPEGSFVVRQVTREPHLSFALHVKRSNTLQMYKIVTTGNGNVKIEHSPIEYRSISRLIAAYRSLKGEGFNDFFLDEENGALTGFQDRLHIDSDEESHATQGDPWTVADVCDWLDELGFAKYTDAFRRRKINGIRLLNLDELDLLQLGMTRTEAMKLLEQIENLSAETVAVPADQPDWVRRTLVVKEIDNEICVLDAETGERIHHLSSEIAKLLMEKGGSKLERANVFEDASAEFFWVGDFKGWARKQTNSQIVYEKDWTPEDLACWMEHISLKSCAEAVRQNQLNVSKFKQLSPSEQVDLGNQLGVGRDLVDAWQLFCIRVCRAPLDPSVADNFENDQLQRESSRNEGSDAFGMIDKFARAAPWCQLELSEIEATKKLNEDARNNTFIVIRDPDDDNCLLLLVYISNVGVKTFRVLCEDNRLRLENTRYICEDLSELVHIFASDNDDKAWLLNFYTDSDEHYQRTWFESSFDEQVAYDFLSQKPPKSFVVFPSQFEDIFTLAYVSSEGVASVNILERPEGFQLEGGSYQVFPTLTDLINHYTFVRINDLGIVLQQDGIVRRKDDFQIDSEVWLRPNLTREDAEDMLTGHPDGAFIVRRSASDNNSWVLSYVYGGEVRHRLINRDSDGKVLLQDSTRKFNSLSDLVNAYCQDDFGELHCPLLKLSEADLQRVPSIGNKVYHSSIDQTTPQQMQQPILDPIYGYGTFPWLMLKPITKSEALGTLIGRPDGAFVIRSSERAQEYLCLSYVFEDQIHHELIGILYPEKDGDSGVHLLRASHRVFDTIYDLVVYYKMPSEELPCCLLDVDESPAVATISEAAPWLVVGLPRDDAVSLLEGRRPGTFLIRESQSSSSHLVLCLMGPDNTIIQEYIEISDEGVFLEKAPDLLFPNLHSLVEYFSYPRPELPCPLIVYETPLLQQPPLNVVSEMSASDAPSQFEEVLTLESQRATSIRLRSKPQLFENNNEQFFVRDVSNNSTQLRAMKSKRTLKWKNFTGTASQLSMSSMSAQEQSQEVRHSHSRHVVESSSREHSASAKSNSVHKPSSGLNREDTIKHTSHALGLYKDIAKQPWMQLDKSLSKVKHMLKRQGDFVVHTSKDGHYACLSMLHNGQIVSRDIIKNGDALRLHRSKESFDRVAALIEHYLHPAQTDLPAWDQKRPQFGSRHLKDVSDVFKHNAWDDVPNTPEQEEAAQKLIQFQRENAVSEDDKERYNNNPGSFWESFYSTHENKFFKNRQWLFTEFPQLMDPCSKWPTYRCDDEPSDAEWISQTKDTRRWRASTGSHVRVLEVGCGAGNTVFPLLTNNPDPKFFVYACDYAPTAVELVKSHSEYKPTRCHAFVCDIANDEIGLPPSSLDAIILIFVLSALHPQEYVMTQSLCLYETQLNQCLKPGGFITFRDYGRHDLAQLRLKTGRYLDENFYIRGDGTRVYFYSQEDIRELMSEENLVEEQNKFDRRLIVNRAKRVTMQRVWLQCKYKKLETTRT
eukprot:gene4370-6657_t